MQRSVEVPRAETAGAEAWKHGADELAKRRRVHGVELVLRAVADVVVVERAARKTHTLRRLVVLQQPLHLPASNANKLLTHTRI